MSRWQAELWRRLRARIGVPARPSGSSAACARLRADAGVVDLPGAAVAVRADAPARRPPRTSCRRSPPAATFTVPAAPLARRCGSGRRGRPSAPDGVRRADDPTTELPRQPAARLLGPRRARDAARARPDGDRARPPSPRRAPRHGTLLGRIQADVRADRDRPDRRSRRATPARARPERPQHPDPRVPRPRPPGRGDARRDPAPARRRTRRSSRAT